MHMKISRVPPGGVAAAAAVAQIALAPRARTTRLSRALASVVTAGSGYLLSAAALRFAREKTTINPLDAASASKIVDTGPYRFTRNPMYVGMGGLLLAHAVSRRSVRGLLPLAAFVAVMDRGQIRTEERVLREKFGAAYEDYTRRVPRWLSLAGK